MPTTTRPAWQDALQVGAMRRAKHQTILMLASAAPVVHVRDDGCNLTRPCFPTFASPKIKNYCGFKVALSLRVK